MLTGKALLEVHITPLFKLSVTSLFTEINIQIADQGPGNFSRLVSLTLTSQTPASPAAFHLLRVLTLLLRPGITLPHDSAWFTPIHPSVSPQNGTSCLFFFWPGCAACGILVP